MLGHVEACFNMLQHIRFDFPASMFVGTWEPSVYR